MKIDVTQLVGIITDDMAVFLIFSSYIVHYCSDRKSNAISISLCSSLFNNSSELPVD